MKNCVVETSKGFRIFNGKIINNGVEVKLSSREIFDILRKTGVRVFELVGNTRVRLTLENYKITNVVPNTVTNTVVEEPVEIPQTVKDSEGDYVGNESAVESEGVVEAKEVDLDTNEETEVEDVEEEAEVEVEENNETETANEAVEDKAVNAEEVKEETKTTESKPRYNGKNNKRK